MSTNGIIGVIIAAALIIGVLVYKGVVKVDDSGGVTVNSSAAQESLTAASGTVGGATSSGTENLYAKAEAQFLAFKYGEAAATYEEALQKNPDDPAAAAAYFRLGKCYKELKQNDKALKYFQEYAKKFPKGGQISEVNKQIELLGGGK